MWWQVIGAAVIVIVMLGYRTAANATNMKPTRVSLVGVSQPTILSSPLSAQLATLLDFVKVYPLTGRQHS